MPEDLREDAVKAALEEMGHGPDSLGRSRYYRHA